MKLSLPPKIDGFLGSPTIGTDVITYGPHFWCILRAVGTLGELDGIKLRCYWEQLGNL
jgi:hypothetical protein